MGLNVKNLLDELTEAEKTAEDTFVKNIVDKEETTKEASATEEDSTEEETSKEASADAEVEGEDSSEEETTKEAEAEESTKETEEEVTSEKTAEEKNTASMIDEETWAKMAADFGKVAAYSLYSELVALGIMPASNMDMVVPTISSVSLPQESPVAVAAEAKNQNSVDHDGYDERTKKASVVSPEFLTKFHNKIFNDKEEN